MCILLQFKNSPRRDRENFLLFVYYIFVSVQKIFKGAGRKLVFYKLTYLVKYCLIAAAALCSSCADKIIFVAAVKVVIALNRFYHVQHCYLRGSLCKLIAALHTLIRPHKSCRNKLSEYLKGKAEAYTCALRNIFSVYTLIFSGETAYYSDGVIRFESKTHLIIIPFDVSIKEILDLFASAGVTELSEGLCFDLSDTLSGNVKFLAHLFKRA